MILHELEVSCLPNEIPDAIMMDISGLAVGESLLVSDLRLPEGVETSAEPEQVVMTILAPQKELSEEEAEDAAVELAEAEARSKEEKLEGTKSL
ncbi:50S ribosomal protein L25 [compost metagenome]